MTHKITFFIGILGVSLFVFSSIIGGLLIDNYSLTSQYISETYAIDTTYGLILRIFGYIPSGILLTSFSFLACNYFKSSKLTTIGFYGLGIFYGFATVLTGIFPCDTGCNKDFINPSTAQIIHNLIGFLTYVFVPFSLLLIGLGLKLSSNYTKLSAQAIASGLISLLFIALLFSDTNSKYMGLYQRIIETLFLLWLISCAFVIKTKHFNDIKL